MKFFSTLILFFINAVGLANGRMYDVAMPYLDPVNCTCVNWADTNAKNWFANLTLINSFENYCAHLGNAPGMFLFGLDPKGAGAESAFCMCDDSNWTPCESNVANMSTFRVRAFDSDSYTHTHTHSS